MGFNAACTNNYLSPAELPANMAITKRILAVLQMSNQTMDCHHVNTQRGSQTHGGVLKPCFMCGKLSKLYLFAQGYVQNLRNCELITVTHTIMLWSDTSYTTTVFADTAVI